MTPSVGQRLQQLSSSMSKPTDSVVVHMRALRMAIGVIAFLLPLALILGENLRDAVLVDGGGAGRRFIETSISAYFHTGVRELFVGSLFAIAVFLVCYRGYERRDEVAAKLAGGCALVIATFATRERSLEAMDTDVRPPDSVTFFSDALTPDPAWVGVVHFTAAAIFFVTLAVMSLFLFTRTDKPAPGAQKRKRNKVYVTCGVLILLSIAAIVIGKLSLSEAVEQRTSFVFWLETVAVMAFGTSWLTKAELIFGDGPADDPARIGDPASPVTVGPPAIAAARSRR